MLTKNSKNKEIIEAERKLCETFKPFIYDRSEPTTGKDGKMYFSVYIALAVPSASDTMTDLQRAAIGWDSFALRRGIINVEVSAIKGNQRLKSIFESMLQPLDLKMVVTQTTQKPYDNATPRIKPGNDNREEEVLCTINNEPIYEVVTFDFFKDGDSRYEYRQFEDTQWQARSIFSEEFIILN